jgi:ribonuclease HI
MIRLHFRMTNNAAEYKALVNGLRIIIELGVQWFYICSDFELIVNQVMGELNCRDLRMAAYRQEVRKLEEKFDASNIITSSDEITRQSTPSPGWGLAMNCPL